MLLEGDETTNGYDFYGMILLKNKSTKKYIKQWIKSKEFLENKELLGIESVLAQIYDWNFQGTFTYKEKYYISILEDMKDWILKRK